MLSSASSAFSKLDSFLLRKPHFLNLFPLAGLLPSPPTPFSPLYIPVQSRSMPQPVPPNQCRPGVAGIPYPTFIVAWLDHRPHFIFLVQSCFRLQPLILLLSTLILSLNSLLCPVLLFPFQKAGAKSPNKYHNPPGLRVWRSCLRIGLLLQFLFYFHYLCIPCLRLLQHHLPQPRHLPLGCRVQIFRSSQSRPQNANTYPRTR